MRKLLIGGGIIVVLAAASGGFWYWRINYKTAPVAVTKPGSISLSNEDKPKQATDLSVSRSDIGQLSLGANQASSNNNNDSANVSSSSSNQPKTITPQDFKQFDQYKNAQTAMFVDMKPGYGPGATAGKTIIVNYRGWLTDGREFDESYAGGKPYSFVLGEHRVIPGWEEGIVGMKVGGQRLLIVPPVAGYGHDGKPPIPGDAVLVFAVELLGVE